MFAAPPKYSDDDIRRGEDAAAITVRSFVVTSALLYLSPFAIEAISKLL